MERPSEQVVLYFARERAVLGWMSRVMEVDWDSQGVPFPDLVHNGVFVEQFLNVAFENSEEWKATYGEAEEDSDEEDDLSISKKRVAKFTSFASLCGVDSSVTKAMGGKALYDRRERAVAALALALLLLARRYEEQRNVTAIDVAQARTEVEEAIDLETGSTSQGAPASGDTLEVPTPAGDADTLSDNTEGSVILDRLTYPVRARRIALLLGKGQLPRVCEKTLLPMSMVQPSRPACRTMEEMLQGVPAEKVFRINSSMAVLQAYIRGFLARQRYKKMVKQEWHREKIVNELLDTEKHYVKALGTLRRRFINPILKDHPEYKVFQDINREMEVIWGVNNTMLEDLSARISHWTHRQCIGDVMFTFSNFLKMYSQYIKSYGSLLEELGELRKDEEFKEVIAPIEKRGDQLESFLIRPVQRIPRYVLLLRDLVKRTPEDHLDFRNLQTATERMEQVAKFVNEHKREHEAMSAVLAISGDLIGKFENIVKPGRRFLQEADFCLSDGEKVHLFLFNDLMIMTKRKKGSKYKVKHVWKLKEIVIGQQIDDEEKKRLVVKQADKSFVFSEVAEAGKGETVAEWIELLLEVKDTLSRTLDVEEEDDEELDRERQRVEGVEFEVGLKCALAESSGKWTQANTDDELTRLLKMEVLKMEAEKRSGSAQREYKVVGSGETLAASMSSERVERVAEKKAEKKAEKSSLPKPTASEEDVIKKRRKSFISSIEKVNKLKGSPSSARPTSKKPEKSFFGTLRKKTNMKKEPQSQGLAALLGPKDEERARVLRAELEEVARKRQSTASIAQEVSQRLSLKKGGADEPSQQVSAVLSPRNEQSARRIQREGSDVALLHSAGLCGNKSREESRQVKIAEPERGRAKTSLPPVRSLPSAAKPPLARLSQSASVAATTSSSLATSGGATDGEGTATQRKKARPPPPRALPTLYDPAKEGTSSTPALPAAPEVEEPVKKRAVTVSGYRPPRPPRPSRPKPSE